MAITYVNSGTFVTAAVSGTPSIPSSTVAGDLAILQVVSASDLESTPAIPSGWVLIGSFSGGGGTFGVGTGPRRLTWFARTLAVGDAAPTVVIAAGTNSMIGAQIFAFHRSAGTGWRFAATFGEDPVSHTSFSAACIDQETFAPNDSVLLGYAINAGVTLSSSAITASGITFSSRSTRTSSAVAVGATAQFGAYTCTVSTGTDLQIPSVNITLASSHTGVAGALRIREATSSLTAIIQGSSPPRVLLSATGLQAENIVAVTLQRVVGTLVADVRGSTNISLLGDDSFVRTDGEQPFGQDVYYQALLVDVIGDTWIITSTTVKTTINNAMLSDALSGQGIEVKIIAWQDKTFSRESTIFNINGRIVVVSGPRTSPTSSLVLFVDTNIARDALNQLLSTATNGIILIRQQPHNTFAGYGGGYSGQGYTGGGGGFGPTCTELDTDTDAYVAVTEDVFTRNNRFSSPNRRVTLSLVEVDAWPSVFEARGSILQDIANYYPDQTLQVIANNISPGTLLSIAQFNWVI